MTDTLIDHADSGEIPTERLYVEIPPVLRRPTVEVPTFQVGPWVPHATDLTVVIGELVEPVPAARWAAVDELTTAPSVPPTLPPPPPPAPTVEVRGRHRARGRAVGTGWGYWLTTLAVAFVGGALGGGTVLLWAVTR